MALYFFLFKILLNSKVKLFLLFLLSLFVIQRCFSKEHLYCSKYANGSSGHQKLPKRLSLEDNLSNFYFYFDDVFCQCGIRFQVYSSKKIVSLKKDINSVFTNFFELILNLDLKQVRLNCFHGYLLLKI